MGCSAGGQFSRKNDLTLLSLARSLTRRRERLASASAITRAGRFCQQEWVVDWLLCADSRVNDKVRTNETPSTPMAATF